MIEKEESKKDANDTLKKLLFQLDEKDTKKAKEQKRKVENYLKDNDISVDEIRKEEREKKEQEKENHKTIPFYVYRKEDNFVNRLEYREIDESGEVILTRKPIMLFIQLKDIEKNYLFNQLKKLEDLKPQCLAYQVFKYKSNRHGLIPSCEICWYAFTQNNEFCERMIKYCRLYSYGFKGPQLENSKWSIDINA